MSTSEPRRRDDAGFTLVEVLVALLLLSVVMVSVLPLVISTLRATALTKVQTQAKNLGQERLEQVKDLRFHIDRQNGPFLDLLDLYYTNATVGAAAISIPASGGTLTGAYVATGGGTNGEPVAPYYRSTTGPRPGATGYSQTIATQFLAADGSVLPAARFQGTYDSQVVGNDRPPALSVAVTVITTWVQGGMTKTFRTYTRVTDGRPQTPVIQSQSRATTVNITSTAADGKTLQLKGGVVSLDGSQSSGSSVSGQVSGALASRTGDATLTGQSVQFSLPGAAAGTPSAGLPFAGTDGTSGCSWFGLGSTVVSPSSGLADISVGLPKAPSSATDASPSANTITAAIKANGTTGQCGVMSYDNQTSGGGVARTDNVGTAMVGAPYVKVSDTGGSANLVAAHGYVTSTPITSVPQKTRSGAAAEMAQPVTMFPRFATNTGLGGLVTAQLTSASVDCTSGTATTLGTARGQYSVTLRWWGKDSTNALDAAGPRIHSATWTYDSNSQLVPLLLSGGDAWSPATTDLGLNGLKLSDLVQLGNAGNVPNVVNTGATNGLRGFPTGVLTLTTAPTLANETSPGFSSIQVVLGQLSCVADDQR